jgi:hypothetical protein
MHEQPPQVQMIQLLAGFQVSQALYTMAKLGIADCLAGQPQPIEAIANRVQADPSSLRRLLRTLASLGVLSEADGHFGLTPLGATLVTDSPGSMRDLALMWMETHYAPFGELADAVRTGDCAATRHYGMPFFDWLSGQPDQVHRFSRAMANLTDGIKGGAVATHDFGTPRRIVDVGGADGALLAQVLTRLPETTGVVFDQPHVIDAARPTIKGYGLDARMETASGDFFESLPPADAYLLSMVIHDWDDDAARRILSNIATAAEPGARVHLVEFVVPPGDTPHMAKMIDLTMLGMLTGRERTDAEFRDLIESAGLRFEQAEATPTPISIVTASAPS